MANASSPIPEFDRVVLTDDLDDQRFKAGDVGTVVAVHEGGRGYEIEFFNLAGETIDVVTVEATQVRPVCDSDITHARKQAS